MPILGTRGELRFLAASNCGVWPGALDASLTSVLLIGDNTPDDVGQPESRVVHSRRVSNATPDGEDALLVVPG